MVSHSLLLDTRSHNHSPVSACSEDLIVDSQTTKTLQQHSIVQQHTSPPPHKSHCTETASPSPATQTAGHTVSQIPTSSQSPTSSPKTRTTESNNTVQSLAAAVDSRFESRDVVNPGKFIVHR